MAEFKLQPREVETLGVTIGEKTFQIPLMGYLTPAQAAGLSTAEGTIAFLNQYIDEETQAMLRVVDYNAITEAWKDATLKAGKSAGE